MSIPVAIYEHQHHGACFRVFNLDREIVAHGYQITERSPPAAPPEAWTSVQKFAKELPLASAASAQNALESAEATPVRRVPELPHQTVIVD